MAGGFGGAYRGVVTNAADPTGAGRVQVRVPAVLGGTSQWAPVCRPFGAQGAAGRVGADVVVVFEGGDPQFPIVVGSLR